MRFSMFYMFAVLGMVGLSGAAWGVEKSPGSNFEEYPYARDVSVSANYYAWTCQKANIIEGTLVETGPNRATCKWECPDGYCWDFAASCNQTTDDRGKYLYRTVVIDPTKTGSEFAKIEVDGDADEDGELDYGTDIHQKAYVRTSNGSIWTFNNKWDSATAGCIPNYAYDHYLCSFTDAKPSVKASALIEKSIIQGKCEFTCADGYKKEGAATYTMTASAGVNGARVVMKATPCTGNAIKVDYDESGGSAATNGSCTYGGTLTLPAAPSRTGYTFVEWKLANGTKGAAGASVACDNKSLGVYEGTSTGKVVAQWTANTYTITLNDNGGSGGSGTVKEVYNTKWTNSSGTTITSVAVPTLSGYSFTGYFDAKTGGNRIIPATGALPVNTTFTSNPMLYAQWSANVYDITYDCGTGATFGTTGKQTKTYENAATYGAAYEIPTDAYCTHPTKPFGGWNFPNQ